MSAPLADAPFDRRVLERELAVLRARLSLRGEKERWMARATGSVVELLDATPGATLQQRWSAIEQGRWACWEAGEQRLAPERQWTWGPAALVLSRAIRPGWELLSRARLSQWLAWLPANDPLEHELAWLRDRSRKPGAETQRLPRSRSGDCESGGLSGNAAAGVDAPMLRPCTTLGQDGLTARLLVVRSDRVRRGTRDAPFHGKSNSLVERRSPVRAWG